MSTNANTNTLAAILQVKAAARNATERSDIARRVFGDTSTIARLVTRSALSTNDLGDDADYRAAAAAFLDVVRKRSLLGKITGWRRVGIDVRVFTEEQALTAAWVSQGDAKPVTSTSLDTARLDSRKIAAILPATLEMMRLAGPLATNGLSRALTRAVADMESASLIDPDSAGVAGEQPASILYGAPTQATTGTVAGDLQALIDIFDGDLEDAVLIAHPKTAIAMHGQGYENAGARGGDVAGIPLVTSTAVPIASDGEILALVDPARVLIADDGIMLDVSTEGTLHFTDASSTTPTADNALSLWQTNSAAILCERSLNWQAMEGAAAYLTGVYYPHPGS